MAGERGEPLRGKKVAILVDDLYEDLELWYPRIRLREAGAEVAVLGSGKPEYVGKHGIPVRPDASVSQSNASAFDAVVVPGGYAPDKMRRHKALLEFVRIAFEMGRTVAFICHGGWVPISAGIVKGRTVTSFFSIADDLRNAGATWVDREVVVDGNLISSRQPEDLPAFARAIIEALSGGA